MVIVEVRVGDSERDNFKTADIEVFQVCHCHVSLLFKSIKLFQVMISFD